MLIAWPPIQVDDAIVEEIRVGVVAVDLKNFTDESPSRPALKMDHCVQGLTDIVSERSIGQARAAPQHATSETSYCLLCVIGLKSSKDSRMPRIHEFQQIERFSAANPADDNPIRSMPDGSFQEVPCRYGAYAVLDFFRLEPRFADRPGSQFALQLVRSCRLRG